MAESKQPPSPDIGIERLAGPESAQRHQAAETRKRTLRPPDWTGPVSVSALALERLAQQQPIPRMSGARAEAAGLRCQLRAARAREDFDAERVLGAQLARLLATRGSELANATKLARRSLLMGDSSTLREELSLWFAGLGELTLAAGTLEPLLDRERDPAPRARHWVRIAVLRARAEDARGAVLAMANAAEADRSDPLPYELLAAVSAWAPETLSRTKASRALLEAAQRRVARGDSRGAIENLLQAFEMAPGYETAAERLARHLAQEGRFQAADEVWRACALASPNPRELHARRIREALGSGGAALALGAAMDAEADRSLDEESVLTAASLAIDGAGRVPVPNFDGLLFPLGLGALLAARLEVVCDIQQGPERAASLLRLSRLCAGPLGDPARSARSLAIAIREEPALRAAFDALSDYSDATGELSELADALYDLGTRETPHPSLRGYLERFSSLAERHNQELGFGVWALRKCRDQTALSPQYSELLQRLEARLPALLEVPDDLGRLTVTELREVLGALAERPEQVNNYASVLEEMRRRDPRGRRWRAELVRCYERSGRLDELELLWREQLNGELEEVEPAFVNLLRHYHQLGQPENALKLLKQTPSSLGTQGAALGSTLASLYGSESQRAAGLALLSAFVTEKVSAVFYSVAAENALSAREPVQALRFAELACKADPSSARSVVAYATVASERHDRVATLALERASEMTIPRAKWCRSLARAAAAQGQAAAELTWLRRWVSLAPLDREGCASLLAALTAGADAEQLDKALSWLLAQAQPVGVLLDEVILALRQLASLDRVAAQRQVARIVGAVGVRDDRLLSALEELAPQLGEPRLMIAVLERRLPSAAPEAAVGLLLSLATLRAQMNDGGGAADALVRALDAGADPARVQVALGALPETTSSDGKLSALQCRARCLTLQVFAESTSEARLAAAHAHREWGAGLWDLANDHFAAIDAWRLAAELDPEYGDERLARDVIAFAGYVDGTPALRRLAAERKPEAGANLLLVAAAVALSEESLEEALELGQTALELQPSRMEALAVIERAATAGQLDLLSAAYEKAAGAILGRFGERALNYRAARQFERRREHPRAFAHAVKAFVAVPAEGVTFALMLRLAAASGQTAAAALAIEQAAAEAKTPERRTLWLERAGRVIGPGVAGQHLRVDVLLRALAVQLEAETLEGLLLALTELRASEPESQHELHRRFCEAVRPHLSGPEERLSAPTALLIARIASELFQDTKLCAAGLGLAIRLDPSLSAGEPYAGRLRADTPAATSFVSAAIAAADAGAPVHADTLRLAESLSFELAPQFFGRTLVAQLRQNPGDLQLLARARQAAVGDASLLEELDQITPWEEEVARSFDRAQALQDTQPRAAAEHLRQLLSESRLDAVHYARAFETLRCIYAGAEWAADLESLLSIALGSERLSVEQRSQIARDLSALLVARAAHAAALDVLLKAEAWNGLGIDDYRRAADIAADCADSGRELVVLTKLFELTQETGRAAVLRRIAQLHEKLGQQRLAMESFRRLLEMVPDDEQARAFLLADAEQREDWSALVELLNKEAQRSPAVGTLLRLAEVLELHLGDPAQARAVMEVGLELLGDQPALLEALALSYRRAGQLAQAAGEYRKASRIAREPAQAAQFAELACRAYLDADDIESAQKLLTVKGIYPHTESLAALRVELARRKGNQQELADSLDELALVSMAEPTERAALLRQAAELSLAMGDPKTALARAQRAARIAPTEPQVRLFTSMLEYRARGAGTAEDALNTIGELRAIRGLQDPALAELRAYLLAEALDRRVGIGAGLNELREAERLLGRRPLVALGLADRLCSKGSSEEALTLYDYALTGDLRGLRDPSEVALFAARYAQQTGDIERALHFALEADTRSGSVNSDVQDLLAELRAPDTVHQLSSRTVVEGAAGASSAASRSPRLREMAPPKPKDAAKTWGDSRRDLERTLPLPTGGTVVEKKPDVRVTQGSHGIVQARIDGSSVAPPFVGDLRPGEHAAVSVPPTVQEPPLEPARPSVQALTRAGLKSTPVQPVAVPKKPAKTQPALASSHPAPSLRSQPLSAIPSSNSVADEREGAARRDRQSKPTPSDGLAGLSRRRFQSTRTSSPLPPAPQPRAVVQTAVSRSFPPAGNSESGLLRELRGGSVEAGLRLAELLSLEDGRIHDLVNVYRMLVALRPGDQSLTRGLLSAVERDNDHVFADAVRHALFVFDAPEAANIAPSLEGQPEQSESLLKLLSPVTPPALEAISLIWHSAPHLFRRAPLETSDYEQLQPTSLTALGVVCSSAARLLGATRTVIRQRLGSKSVGFTVHLQNPVVLDIDGDGQSDSPEFRYHFGAMLLATRPEYALTYGLSTDELRVLCEALLAAFGPPRRLSGDVAGVAQFAERLWEGLSARVQRRLQELCVHPDEITYEHALEGTNRALRRAGLFLAADLGVAVRQVCIEDGEELGVLLRPDGLRKLCGKNEHIADLVRFATSLEYAEARWHPARVHLGSVNSRV